MRFRYQGSLEGVKSLYEAENTDIENLVKMMEEMANQSKEPMGKRQPGERCSYEIPR